MWFVKMTKSPNKRKKRSKLTIALLSPILMVVFMAGWCLAWIGESKLSKTKQPHNSINKTSEKEEMELIFISNQEEQIRTS
jgi:flagellar basal body-associated protein FliL